MLIPFISQLPDNQQQAWIIRLNKLVPQANIVLAANINPNVYDVCQLAIVANPKPDIVAQFKNLTWLQSLWAGVDGLAKEFLQADFEIVRLIDPCLAQTMAEAVLAWTLYLHRDMPLYREQQQQNIWQQHPLVPATEKQVTILGLGELGQACAQRLANNQFKVVAWSRTLKQVSGIKCFAGNDGLEQALANADIVVCLLPLTLKTRHLIDEKVFKFMPKGTSFINFARGGVVDTKALINELTSNHIKHAVLDVFEQEPLPMDSQLWQQPNVTVLPHISAATNIASASAIVADNINQFISSGVIPQGIDKSLGY